MNLDVNFLSRTTRVLLSSGIILLILGNLVRWLNIYYCWESKQIGYIITFLGIICLFRDWSETRKKLSQNSIFTKSIHVFLIAIFCIQLLVLIIIPNSQACETARNHLRANQDVRTDIGKIKQFGFITNGAIEYKFALGGKTGKAKIRIIAKGENGYREYTVQLNKQVQSGWAVEWVE